jgi:hypothetical protein
LKEEKKLFSMIFITRKIFSLGLEIVILVKMSPARVTTKSLSFPSIARMGSSPVVRHRSISWSKLKLHI